MIYDHKSYFFALSTQYAWVDQSVVKCHWPCGAMMDSSKRLLVCHIALISIYNNTGWQEIFHKEGHNVGLDIPKGRGSNKSGDIS